MKYLKYKGLILKIKSLLKIEQNKKYNNKIKRSLNTYLKNVIKKLLKKNS